ncbi:MAG: hypothetical protein JWR15_3821 [Prosthecobacter sp.]|nr:hypothetical protein [Prosthecobacter sp.]
MDSANLFFGFEIYTQFTRYSWVRYDWWMHWHLMA